MLQESVTIEIWPMPGRHIQDQQIHGDKVTSCQKELTCSHWSTLPTLLFFFLFVSHYHPPSQKCLNPQDGQWPNSQVLSKAHQLRHKFYDLNELDNIYFSLAEVYHKDSVKYVWKRNMTYQSKNIQSIISQKIHSLDAEGTAMSKTVTDLVFTCLHSWLGEKNSQLANTLQTVINTKRNKSAGVRQIILVYWEEGLIEKVTFQQRLT